MDSLLPLMHHDPNRSCITDPDCPDPDHPKGMHPLLINSGSKRHPIMNSLDLPRIIQDNLFYLTVNNNFVIVRESGKKGKGEVCINTDNLNLNAMFFRLRV